MTICTPLPTDDGGALPGACTLDHAFGGTDDFGRTVFGRGWSTADREGRWTCGTSSELAVTNPGNADLLLEVDAFPSAPLHRGQALRIAVEANGSLVGDFVLRGRCRLWLTVPASVFKAWQRLCLRFLNPAAATSPRGTADFCLCELRLHRADAGPVRRREGSGGLRIDRLRAITGQRAADIVGQFESLGDACEFGLVQRRAGIEPVSLFRFTYLHYEALMRGLGCDFAGIADPGSISCRLNPKSGEYVILDKNYGLDSHTFMYEADIDVETLLTQQAARFKFLARKLIKSIASGNRIFVIRRSVAQPQLLETEVRRLFDRLNSTAPNALLWVSESGGLRSPGTVEVIVPGLLHGYLDRLAPDDDMERFCFNQWLEICANALVLLGRLTMAPAMAAAPLPAAPAGRGQLSKTDVWPNGGLLALHQISFGAGGNDRPYLGAGWSTTEPNGRWTEGDACELLFPQTDRVDVILSIDFWPATNTQTTPAQSVTLLINGSAYDSFEVQDASIYRLYIPAGSYQAAEKLTLVFLLPDAFRPSEAGMPREKRELALCFRRLRLAAAH